MCYKKRELKNKVLDKHRSGFDKVTIKAPCGTCPACRKLRSNDMLVRAYFEFLGNDRQGFFVSLDFDDDHLPTWYGKPCFDSNIMKHFLARLRHYVGSFRYLYSTDYGGLLHRPHYHFACFPDKQISHGDFIRAIVATWQQGSHTDIELIQSVDGNKLKAIEYVVGYATKDITWINEDFAQYDEKMPPRFRPRCQPSNGFGLRALEEGIIKPDDFLTHGTVSLPIGANGKLVKFSIPRYYEMKLCYDYHWDPVKHKAELVKNEFGVVVCKSRHNAHYNHFMEIFRSSSGLDVHDQEFYKGSIFDGLKWHQVVSNCLSNLEDFGEYVYFRPFIDILGDKEIHDTVRNEVLIRPSWKYYEASVKMFEKYRKLFDDAACKVKTDELVINAKLKALARIKHNSQLRNYLIKKNFDFSQLNL